MRQMHFFHSLKNKELDELYLSIAIRNFAISLISVFVPIFLLNNGLSLKTILVFYAVLNISHIVFLAPASVFSAKYGFKHSIFASLPFLIMFYWMLFSIKPEKLWLFITASAYGANNAFYYMGYHLDFTDSSHKKTRGKEIGIAKIISMVFNVLGPLIGGVILSLTDFKTIFFSVICLLGLSVMPLFFSKDRHMPFKFSLKKILRIMPLKMLIKDTAVFLGHGIESGISSVIWPLFIYKILSGFRSIGLASTISLAFSLCFCFIIGRLADKKGKKILGLGSIANSAIWLIRTAIKTITGVYIFDSAKGISQIMIDVPFQKISYDKAKKAKKIIEYTFIRETAIQAGRAALFIILAQIINIENMRPSFFAGAIASLLYLLF